MPTRLRSLLSGVATGIPTLLTLALLAGVAVWGSHNNWTLPSLAHLGEKEAPPAGASAEESVKVLSPSPGQHSGPEGSPPPVPTRLEFPSAAAVQKVGLVWKPAQVQDMAQYVTATGAVDYEPSLYARLTARASGAIWGVYKEIGQPVRKGDVLALIDAGEVGRAKTDFLQSLGQVQVRSTTLERLQATAQEGAVPEQSLRTARAALREARLRLFTDQQTLLNFGLPVRLQDVQDLPEPQLVQRLRLLGLPDSLVKQHDPETLTANLLPLTAPFDGVVVQRNAAPGEFLESTQRKTLFVVADVRRLHIDLDVLPEDMASVKVSQRVNFRPDPGTLQVPATVSHISPEVDETTRRVRVHAEVDNSAGRLRPNAFGTGRILVREHPRAVVVPEEAVQSDGKDQFVFVRVSKTMFEVRPVQPDVREGGLIAVQGVQPGEEVVTTGSYVLKSELLKDRITGGDE